MVNKAGTISKIKGEKIWKKNLKEGHKIKDNKHKHNNRIKLNQINEPDQKPSSH